jgi:large subunit ribosomal protein L29
MAHIVELRQMSDEQLEDKLENAREEMFNLRFQQASARLQDTARLRVVRREIAQIREVLHKRELAVSAAAAQPEVAAALDGKKWQGRARFVYEDSSWDVTFLDNDGSELATAVVNLNRKNRRDEKPGSEEAKRRKVQRVEVTG